jgi:hypothetical protein
VSAHRELYHGDPIVPADVIERVGEPWGGSVQGLSPRLCQDRYGPVTGLAQIVNGTSQVQLLEPITTGFWITVSVDTVHALDQQYRA